jgi:2-C-methyl-D-erythritol 2,4-cyclodiphosphate synthase
MFLEAVVRLLAERAWAVENVDSTVIAEGPPLAPHLPAMRATLAGALGLPVERVSVKAKSADGLGAIGHGEGIAAQAVALVRAR